VSHHGECFTKLTCKPGPNTAPYHSRQVVVLGRTTGRDGLISRPFPRIFCGRRRPEPFRSPRFADSDRRRRLVVGFPCVRVPWRTGNPTCRRRYALPASVPLRGERCGSAPKAGLRSERCNYLRCLEKSRLCWGPHRRRSGPLGCVSSSPDSMA
jgi:hypothetical protein